MLKISVHPLAVWQKVGTGNIYLLISILIP